MRPLKLAAHVHTAASDDSDWELRRLATVLRSSGFNGMLVCDHDRTMTEQGWQDLQKRCHRVGDELGFLVVPGIEYQDPDHVVHLPVFGAHQFLGASPDIAAALPRVRADGAAPVFAHPGRRDAYTRFDPAWATHLVGLEVWNRKYDGIRPNSWALGTAQASGLQPMVALDWHGPRQLFPLALRLRDPGPADNAERAAAAVAAMVAGEARVTAFGLPVERFSDGALGAVMRQIEKVRAWSAPRIRRLEAAMGRRS